MAVETSALLQSLVTAERDGYGYAEISSFGDTGLTKLLAPISQNSILGFCAAQY
jgi:hypothetical protein